MKTTILILLFTLICGGAMAQTNKLIIDTSVVYYKLTIVNSINPMKSGGYFIFSPKDIIIDNGISVSSIGLKKDDGLFFTSNMNVLDYVCKKYNIELFYVGEYGSDPNWILKKK